MVGTAGKSKTIDTAVIKEAVKLKLGVASKVGIIDQVRGG